MVDDTCLVLLLLSTLAFVNPLVASPALASAPEVLTDMPSTSQQLRNIVEALIGASDFQNWANVLSATDPSTFPLTATFFIPSDEALSRFPSSLARQFDPSIILYHFVPQQLTFSHLQRFPIGSRLPTLLPNNSILVTNNAQSNFTIDDSRLTHPDLYINGAFSVHGIGSLLNYSAYGGDGILEEQLPRFPPESQDSIQPRSPLGESMDRHHSVAPCSCTEFSIILSIACAIFAFKIHRNPLIR